MKQRRGNQFSSQLPEQQESIISLKIYYQHGSTLHVIASAACDNSVSPAIPWNMNRENVVNISPVAKCFRNKERYELDNITSKSSKYDDRGRGIDSLYYKILS